MKTLESFLWFAATLVAASSIYEAVLLKTQTDALNVERRTIVRTRDELTTAHGQLTRTKRELEEAEDFLAAVQVAGSSDDGQHRSELRRWAARVGQLKQSFETRPDQRIPEMQRLLELDWFSLAHRLTWETEDEQRRAWATVRHTAIQKLLREFSRALKDYVGKNEGLLPEDIFQLAPYFAKPMDPAILARYEVHGHGLAKDYEKGQFVNTIAERAPVDEDYDWLHTMSTDGRYYGPWETALLRNAVAAAGRAALAERGSVAPQDILGYISDPTLRAIAEATTQFRKHHNGQEPNGAAELRPYVQEPAARARLEKMIRQERNNPAVSP